MNDRLGEKAKCPFFVSSIFTKHMVGIECEGLTDNLGFEVRHYTRFENYRETTDYAELFCNDLFESCPYYQALLATKYKGGT